ncbi:MAG: glycine cleavage system aminomethyltransferase GcvT [Microbacterium sp.]|uniref:glycine cleavage system aminomethyltransferase GcvT n=1 Tax=Microbacterium sp. TaxID=51671 RepID=UPI0039E568DD
MTRTTSLHARHVALGAAFTDFGGWSMPVRYTSDLAEHHAVRTAAGLFDISHMAEFEVAGADAAAFLDHALAGLVSVMRVGKAKYSLVLSESGGIVDDVIVYRLAEDRYLVVANAGNRHAVAAAFRERGAAFADASVDDLTDRYSLIAVQGPAAESILAATDGIAEVSVPWGEQGYYAWASARFAGEPLLVARTGYTGEDGFELLVRNAAAVPLWDALLAAGAPLGLVPAGLAARDTLRLEAGMPLYGHELSLDVQPAQAGLGRVAPLATKTADFVGRAALEAGPPAGAPVLVGLVGEGRRAGRAGYAVLDADGARVGEITSGALSPTLGRPVAMAFVAPAVAAPGAELSIDVRGTRIPATVTALPFYRRKK